MWLEQWLLSPSACVLEEAKAAPTHSIHGLCPSIQKEMGAHREGQQNFDKLMFVCSAIDVFSWLLSHLKIFASLKSQFHSSR